MPLALMALVGTFGLNFQVILPLLARFSFDGGAGVLRGAGRGDGRRLGRRRPRQPAPTAAPTPRLIAGAALSFGVLAALAAVMPSIALEVPMVALLGASAVTFAAAINSSLQLAVEPEMRGRVMALYSVVFLGSTPIGGPLAGWLSEAYDPRVALLLAGDRRDRRRLGGPRLLRPDARPHRDRAPPSGHCLGAARRPAGGLDRTLPAVRPTSPSPDLS